MAFVDTLESLGKVIIPKENPVELTITNNTITIDPNSGSYFFLDDIDSNLTINISSLNTSSKTIYLKLNFDEDNIVINWPNNIKWQELTSPSISQYEDLFISLMTLDGGTTWYSEPVIKTKPLVDFSNYMSIHYPTTYQFMTEVPEEFFDYYNSVRAASLNGTFENMRNLIHFIHPDMDTSNVTTMRDIFYINNGSQALKYLDLSNWDTSKVSGQVNISGQDDLIMDISGWTNLNNWTLCLNIKPYSDGGSTSYSAVGFYRSYIILDNPNIVINGSDSDSQSAYQGLIGSVFYLVPSEVYADFKESSNWSSLSSYILKQEDYTITKTINSIMVSPKFDVIESKYTEYPARNWAQEFYPSTYSSITSLDSSGRSYLTSVSPSGHCDGMFFNCSNLINLDLSGVDLSKVTSFFNCISGCDDLETIDLDNAKVSNAVTQQFFISKNPYMGGGTPSIVYKLRNLSTVDVSNVTTMYNMFRGCTSLTSLDLSNWNTSSVSDMSFMFRGCTSLTSLDLSNWNTSSVSNMNNMFNECTSLTSLDLSNWNTSSVSNMSYMFNGCTSLTSLDLSNWDTSSVTSMEDMFNGCTSLTSLDLSNWNTSSVSNMSYMFYGCTNLSVVDLSSWNFASLEPISLNNQVGRFHYMFQNSGIRYVILNSNTVKIAPYSVLFRYSGDTTPNPKILVPEALLSNYRSTYSSNQFDAIENYTITRSNGQVTVTPNNS